MANDGVHERAGAIAMRRMRLVRQRAVLDREVARLTVQLNASEDRLDTVALAASRRVARCHVDELEDQIHRCDAQLNQIAEELSGRMRLGLQRTECARWPRCVSRVGCELFVDCRDCEE
jgi:hypothetical protein